MTHQYTRLSTIIYTLVLLAMTARAQTGGWTQEPDFPGGTRSKAVGFTIGNQCYAGTGYDGFAYTEEMWAFDAVAGTWAQIADLAGVARENGIAFAIGGKGYVGLGRSTGGTLVGDLWEYDPIADTWTAKAPFPGPLREWATSFSMGGKGYVCLGLGDTYLNDLWEYDPALDTWTAKAALPAPARINAAGFVIGNKAYVATGEGNTFYSDVWAYDPVTDTWTPKAGFGGTARSGAAAFTIGTTGYVGMGYDGAIRNDLWAYDASLDTWSQKADMGAGRSLGVSLAANGRGFLCFGYVAGIACAELWAFDPDPSITCTVANTALCPDAAPFNVAYSTSLAFNTGNIFTAELSDDGGDFATPTSIGTLAGTTSGTIAASIPSGTAPGEGYRIRVVSSDPPTTGSVSPVLLTIDTIFEWHADADGDAHGDPAQNQLACLQPSGWILDGTDCDDTDAARYPGAACDDGNTATGDDTYDGACMCLGLLIDCAGTPGGNALPGTACNDCDPSTFFDTYSNDCVCTGTLTGDLLYAAGSNDPSFDPGSGFTGGAGNMALQPDGKVVVVGSFTAFDGTTRNHIARLNSDGSLDAGYATGTGFNGLRTTDLALLPDGRAFVSGEFTSYNGTARNSIARLKTNGTLDATFNPGTGFGPYSITTALALQPNGKVLVAGYFTSFDGAPAGDLVRLNASGTLDPTFNIGLGFDYDPLLQLGAPGELQLDADGWLVVLGGIHWYDGLSPLVGDICRGIARLSPLGGFDGSFQHGNDWWDETEGFNSSPGSVALMDDGRMYIGGDFTAYFGVTRNRIIRLNADGTLDPTFDPGTGFNDQVTALALQPDGKLLVGGAFTSYQGVPRERIARLNPDGSLDETFQPCAGFNGIVHDFALQPDGRLIVTGDFTAFGGSPRNGIARLFTVDATCIPTQLTTTADPVISCGAVNLKFNGTNTIAATEVPGANKYQFRFTNIPGQPAYARNIAWQSRSFTLTKWLTNPLKAGRTYNVVVRASFDDGATWCEWGPSCTVRISWTPMTPATEPRDMDAVWTGAPELTLYPNPTNGDELNISLSDLDPELTSVSLDITDLFGKRVMTSTLAVQDGGLNSVLPLTPDLAVGLYVVTITAGDQVFNERLVIAR